MDPTHRRLASTPLVIRYVCRLSTYPLSPLRTHQHHQNRCSGKGKKRRRDGKDGGGDDDASDATSDWSGDDGDDDASDARSDWSDDDGDDASVNDSEWSDGESHDSVSSDPSSPDDDDVEALLDKKFERKDASGQSCNFCDHPARSLYIHNGGECGDGVCVCNASDCRDELLFVVDEQFSGKMYLARPWTRVSLTKSSWVTQAMESPSKLRKRGLMIRLAPTMLRHRQRARRPLNRDEVPRAIFMRAVDEISVWSLAANHRMTGEMKEYTLRNGWRCGRNG